MVAGARAGTVSAKPKRLKAKLVGCTVTGTNCCMFDALMLDELLMGACGVIAGELVEVTLVRTGESLTTAVQAAPQAVPRSA